MSISMFETRTMLDALVQAKKPTLYLRDKYFNNIKVFDTKTVDIDLVSGGRRIAPYVNPIKEGKMVEGAGYSTNSYTPPYLKPKMLTDAVNILNRNPGNNIYGDNKSPAEKAQIQLGKDLFELNEQIDRVEELQCSQALQTGIITVTGDGVNDTIDFQMKGTHKITLLTVNLWSDTTNSDPIKDLDDWVALVQKDSGLNPGEITMDIDAGSAFLNHPKVQAYFDKLRINFGTIEPQLLPNGVTYLATLPKTGCKVYQYNAWYTDTNGTTQPYLDSGRVIMGSTQARTDRLYGAIQDIESNFAVARFPKSWPQKDPSGQILLLQSAPLMALHQVDAFVTAVVL